MTDTDRSSVDKLTQNVEKLTKTVVELRIAVERHMEGETSCRRDVASIHAEVFGIDGDPHRPGLKGQMRDVKYALAVHDGHFVAIRDTYRSGISKAWALVVSVISAVIGGVVGWLSPRL